MKKEKLQKEKAEQANVAHEQQSLIANRGGKARPKVQMSFGLGMKKKT